MSGVRRFPARVDTVVVGPGTAGAAVAGHLAAGSPGRMLLEAGLDYRPAGSSRWPRELLDATRVASSHDWDGWAAAGNADWSARDLGPLFAGVGAAAGPARGPR